MTLETAERVWVGIGGDWVAIDASVWPRLPYAKPQAFCGYGILHRDALSLRTWLYYALAYLQVELTELDCRIIPTLGQAPGSPVGADSSKRCIRWAARGTHPHTARTVVQGQVLLVVDAIDLLVPYARRLREHFVFRAGDPEQTFSPQMIRATLLSCPSRVIRRMPVEAHHTVDGTTLPRWRTFAADDAMNVLQPYCLDSLGAACLIVHELIGQARHREAQRAAEIVAAATTILFNEAGFLAEAMRSIALGIDEVAHRPARFWSLPYMRSIVSTSPRSRAQTKSRQRNSSKAAGRIDIVLAKRQMFIREMLRKPLSTPLT